MLKFASPLKNIVGGGGLAMGMIRTGTTVLPYIVCMCMCTVQLDLEGSKVGPVLEMNRSFQCIGTGGSSVPCV